MADRYKPYCSDEQFHALHEAIDRTRKSSATVTVPRDALAKLLMDHAKLWQISKVYPNDT